MKGKPWIVFNRLGYPVKLYENSGIAYKTAKEINGFVMLINPSKSENSTATEITMMNIDMKFTSLKTGLKEFGV